MRKINVIPTTPREQRSWREAYGPWYWDQNMAYVVAAKNTGLLHRIIVDEEMDNFAFQGTYAESSHYNAELEILARMPNGRLMEPC